MPIANGSMEKGIVPLLVDHIERNVRTLPVGKIVVCLDGHSSRNGFDWLESCVEKGIEVVQSPANTSHFLQPCDSFIYKCFQKAVRTQRDTLCLMAVSDTKAIWFKLMFGAAGFRAISQGIVQASLTATGLWPMDYRFLNKFRTE